jgi:XTP/dITP diphosphohydrolase
MQLLIATRNKHKLRELQPLLAELKFEIRSVADMPNLPEVVEDEPTVRDNAIKKALTTASLTGLLTLADDTGLEVDALNGEPGVRSARFAGEKATYHENNKTLLKLLDGVPAEKRRAAFRCVAAIADKDGLVEVVEGICNGMILEEERGGGGFGYDPLFLPDGQVKTFSELPLEVKNRISHRAKAMQKAWAVLSRYQREHGGGGGQSAVAEEKQKRARGDR